MPEEKRSVEGLLSEFVMLQTKFMMVNYLNGMVEAHAGKDEKLIARYADLLQELLTFAIKNGMLDAKDLEEATKISSAIN